VLRRRCGTSRTLCYHDARGAARAWRAREIATSDIALSQPWFDDAEAARVAQALRGRVGGDGPFGRRVEQRLREQLGVARVLLTTSCTHAMELALLALDLPRGGEVLVPSFTFTSTANAVLRAGLVPVLCDVEPVWLGLDPQAASARVSARSVALMPVHYAGWAADMEGLLALAARHGLRVVEDAAQGLFASWRGRPLGTLGDAGCFSFHETKNLTCGEGGALALRAAPTAARAEVVREKGTNRSAFLRGEVDKYTWVAEGSSYVLGDVLAALLDAQLDKAAAIHARRAAVAARYHEALAPWARRHGVRLPPGPGALLDERGGNHHVFHLLFADEAARDRSLRALRRRGVGAAFHYVPLHAAPFARTLAGARGEFPVSERVAATLLRLPLHPLLEPDDVARVIDAVLASLD
jgi:dTDP-4-amino-4,6-dideoxygalactose transaminase